MPITPFDFSRVFQSKHQEPRQSLFENMMRAYEVAGRPQEIAQEERMRGLNEQLLQSRLDQSQARSQAEANPEMYELKKRLMEAKIAKEQSLADSRSQGKTYAPSNMEKDISAYERYEKEYGKDSWQAKAVKARIESNKKGMTAAQSNTTYFRALGNVEAKALADPKYSLNQRYKGKRGIANVPIDIAAYGATNDPKKKKELGDRIVQATLAMMLVPERAISQVRGLHGGKPTKSEEKSIEKSLTNNYPPALREALSFAPQELLQRADDEYRQAQVELGIIADNFEKAYRGEEIGGEEKEGKAFQDMYQEGLNQGGKALEDPLGIR